MRLNNVGIPLLIVVSLIAATSCKQNYSEDYELETFKKFRDSYVSQYQMDVVLFGLLDTDKDTMINQELIKYGSFIDSCFRSKTKLKDNVKYGDFELLDSLLLVPRYFYKDSLSFMEHILLEKDLFQTAYRNDYSFNRFHLVDQVKVFGGKGNYIFKEGESDSILIGLNYHISGRFTLNEYEFNDSIISENADEFYLKVNTTEKGSHTINGKLKFLTASGDKETLSYSIPYIVK